MALDYLPSPGWAVIYGETPSATRWSELGDNDDALATGAGIDDLAILTRHLADVNVTTRKMKPTYSVTAGNSGASRQTMVGAGTFAITGLSKSYTSGPTNEILLIFASALIQAAAVGGQFFLAINGVPFGRSDYLDVTGAFVKNNAIAFYEIPANTTVTIDARFKNISGTTTIAQQASDVSLSPSYAGELSILAFGR